jgi:chromosome segregation ATPase
MADQLARTTGPDDDLDATDQFLALNVAAYEAQIAAPDDDKLSRATERTAPIGDDNRPAVPALPPVETLGDIEAWIAAHSARDRASTEILARLRSEQAEANARADGLATELESLRGTLDIALGRANSGERALRDAAAKAGEHETRIAELTAAVEQTRLELSSSARRLAGREAELKAAHASVISSRRTEAERVRAQTELSRTLEERSSRLAQLETELAAIRARLEVAERELTQRTETIATLTATRNGSAASVAKLEHAQRDAEARANRYLENLQSREWQRSNWEGMWHDLDAELDEARASLGRLAREHAEMAAAADRSRAELGERTATIERLQSEQAGQAAALRELMERRSRDDDAAQAAARELAARHAALVAEVGALKDAQRQTLELLTARESELAEVSAARAATETTLRTAQAKVAAQGERIAELEAVTVGVAQALQTQTDAVHQLTTRLEAGDREAVEKDAHIRNLMAELNGAAHDASGRASAVRASEMALAESAAQLTVTRERLQAAEHEAANRGIRVAALETELAAARTAAGQVDAQRLALGAELERLGTELSRETARVGSLEAKQREVTLELARSRGALEERELRIRRLERQATSSAEALARIKFGIEQGAQPPAGKPAEFVVSEASLVPLDGDSPKMLPIGRRTTVGRAPDNDLCINDRAVSRHHAVMFVSSNGSFVEDQGSVNGVMVNGRRVRHARLAAGDLVTFGLKRFRFTVRAASDPAAH